MTATAIGRAVERPSALTAGQHRQVRADMLAVPASSRLDRRYSLVRAPIGNDLDAGGRLDPPSRSADGQFSALCHRRRRREGSLLSRCRLPRRSEAVDEGGDCDCRASPSPPRAHGPAAAPPRCFRSRDAAHMSSRRASTVITPRDVRSATAPPLGATPRKRRRRACSDRMGAAGMARLRSPPPPGFGAADPCSHGAPVSTLSMSLSRAAASTAAVHGLRASQQARRRDHAGDSLGMNHDALRQPGVGEKAACRGAVWNGHEPMLASSAGTRPPPASGLVSPQPAAVRTR